MSRTVVGLIRGGTGSETDLSLKTGATLLHALPEDTYDVRDILIDQKGQWHVRGLPATPIRALQQLDVAVNALHGGMGEDGTVQRIAQIAGVRLTGSPPTATWYSLHKAKAREILTKAGVRMPRGIVLALSPGTTADTGIMARAVFEQFGPPYIIKPVSEGASHGILVARTWIDLGDMLADMLDVFGAVVVEEYVRGQEATVGVIQDFRNEPWYALPPAEIAMPRGHLFMPSSAYREGLSAYAPAPSISHDHKQELMRLAKLAHATLGLEHYSRADFIVTPRGPYLLEVNALPGLYEGAAFPVMLDAVGARVADFAAHLIRRELRA